MPFVIFSGNRCRQINAGWHLDVDKRCTAEYMRDIFDSHLNGDWSVENDRKKRLAKKSESSGVDGSVSKGAS